MWMTFAFAVLAGAVALYVPGYLLLRACGLPRAWAFASAPLPSIALVALMGEALRVLGPSASPLSVLGPPIVLGVIACAVKYAKRGGDIELPQIPAFELGLAALAGATVCFTFFAGNLSSPELIFPSMDIVHHINVVRAFLDSGVFSSITQDAYMTSADLALDPYPGTSFYPSAWHALCALIVQLSGASVAAAINALNFCTGAFVFPLAMVPVSALVLGDQARARALAVLASVSFAIFPWALFVFGPIFPNLLGFAVVPAEMWLCLRLFGPDAQRRERLTCAGLVLFGIVALGLLHPNTVFTCGVWVAPYLVLRVYQLVATREANKAAGSHNIEGPRPVSKQGLLAAALTVAGLVGAWVVCLHLPFFASVLSSVWDSFTNVPGALFNVAAVGYTRGFWPEPHLAAQFVVAALVLVGVVRTLREGRWRWLSVAYALAGFAVVAASSIDPPVKNWVAGFWYTDPFRVGSMAAIFGMPLAALGLDWLCEAGERLVALRRAKALQQKDASEASGEGSLGLATAVVTLVCILGIFISGIPLPGGGVKLSAFGAIRRGMNATYGLDDLYGLPERAFVERAMERIPEGAAVVNYPYDGSLIAYGASGLRCYWRFVYGYGDPLETADSALIRQHLCEVAEREDVREALARNGLEYVLMLHYSEGSNNWYVGYDVPWEFDGMRFINDSTPGFETVLAEGDMRLYRIVA